MILKSIFILFFCYIGARKAQADDFYVMENSSPAIRDANVTFTVSVTNHTGELLKFWIYDDTGYSASIITREQTFNHSVHCKKEIYDAGGHGMELRVFRKTSYDTWIMYGDAYSGFNLTDTLNGGPKMIQRGEDVHTDYVYPYSPVYHYLEIPHEEHMYLEQEHTQRLYYWYIDCALVDVSRDFYMVHAYSDDQKTYDLRVVLVVKKKKISTTTTTAAPVLHPGLSSDDDFSRTSSTTSEAYNNEERGIFEAQTSRSPSSTTSRPLSSTTDYDSHYIAKRGVYSKRSYKHELENGHCLPNNDGDIFAYGVYDQTIHIIDRFNLPTTSTTSTTTTEPIRSTTTTRPIWSTETIEPIRSTATTEPSWSTETFEPTRATTTTEPITTDKISPTTSESTDPWLVPTPRTKPTTEKDENTSVKILNSTVTGDIPPFSISTKLPRNVHFRGMLNILLRGSFNFEYTETQQN